MPRTQELVTDARRNGTQVRDRPLRLVVADEHALFLETLASFLRASEVDVLGAVSEPRQLLQLAASRRPEICLLDGRFFRDTGASLQPLRGTAGMKLVLLTTERDRSVESAIRSGLVEGVVERTQGLDDLLTTLHKVAAGERVCRASDRAVARAGGYRGQRPCLSDREKDVLRLMLTGASNAEIAAALGIGVNTVRTHLYNATQKLGVHGNGKSVRLAVAVELSRDRDALR